MRVIAVLKARNYNFDVTTAVVGSLLLFLNRSWEMPQPIVVFMAVLRELEINTYAVCALELYYAAYSGNFLRTFRVNLSVSPSKVKKSKVRA